MLDQARAVDIFRLRVLELDSAFIEERMDIQIHVLVDRRAEDASAALAEVARQVRSAAAETDPEWRSRDDHGRPSVIHRTAPARSEATKSGDIPLVISEPPRPVRTRTARQPSRRAASRSRTESPTTADPAKSIWKRWEAC